MAPGEQHFCALWMGQPNRNARAVGRAKPSSGEASRMLERGATLAEVKDALGHSSIATTSIYLHSNPEHLRAHMEI